MPICNKNNKIRCQSSAVHDVSNAFITQLLRNAPNMRLRQQIHRWKRRARTNTSTPWAGRCLDVPTTSDSTLISHCRQETCAVQVRLACPRAWRHLACCEWWSLARCSTRNKNQCWRSSFAHILNDVLDCVARPTAQQSRLWWRTCFASRTSVDAPCPQIDSYRAGFSVVPTIIINNGGVFSQQTY